MSTHKSPALFRRPDFNQHQPTVERGVAIFLLILSWLGTLLWGGGGWEAWSVIQPYPPGLTLGLVLQGICTGIQWVYSNRWGSLWARSTRQKRGRLVPFPHSLQPVGRLVSQLPISSPRGSASQFAILKYSALKRFASERRPA